MVSGGWTLGRRAGLDGLRGVAILLVLVCHIVGTGRHRLGVIAVGAAGVTLFFTLSGFLITSLLIEEHAASGKISLRRFYVRRARRLFPALFVMLGLLCLAGLDIRSVVPVVFYYENWATLANGPSLIGHTWSLSVEEQFYLAWPVLLIASLRWKPGPLIASATGALAALSLHVVLHGSRVYLGSDTEAFGLLLGALLATLAHRGLAKRSLPKWATWMLVGLLFALVLSHSEYLGYVVVPTVVPVVGVFLVWSICCTDRTLTAAPLRYFGERSYGIYLWHYPLIVLLRDVIGATLFGATISAALAIAIAELSWRLVERPFTRSRTAAIQDSEQPPHMGIRGLRLTPSHAPTAPQAATPRPRSTRNRRAGA